MLQVFSVFPELFAYQIFALTLLRISAAYAFLYIANSLIQDRHKIAEDRVPVIGHPGVWFVWFSALLIGLVGCLFAVGLYTQVAAIAGMLLAAKSWIFLRRYPHMIPLSRDTYALLFVICAALLISGAGAFAFDLPL